MRGLTAWAAVDEHSHPVGVLVALHTAGPDDAQRVAERVVRPLAERFGKNLGRPLEWALCGSTVALGWGEGVLAFGRDVPAHPAQSAGAAIRASWGDAVPQRAGVIWPGRLAPLLEDAPPILWWGTTDQTTTRDTVRCDALRQAVARCLARLPHEPNTGR